MHADETFADAAVLQRLIERQFPQWADLPITPVGSGGTSNAIYRLGTGMAARLPLRPSGAGQAALEQQWLPRLAPHLPIDVAMPIALGEPGEGYPLPWSIVTWIEGEIAEPDRLADPHRFAIELAAFIRALRAIDLEGGPPPRQGNSGRGVPLSRRGAAMRAALAASQDVIDVRSAERIWEESLHAPQWNGPPCWIHGDLNPGNLIMREGRLAGVIDFGSFAVGDPACDLLAAWYALPAAARPVFRKMIEVDEASWSRGRGWALSMAVIALPYYRDTNPWMVRHALRVVSEILAE
ncbi:MAG: aminoglycoside phosphotransferase family protein [Proteobacteria bacterium]|nr:aminoglycoside phosphotransferase family protein [Pseudomonadota bacterium]